MKIELIYFDGCPNADKARENIRKAFAAAGIDMGWTEWEQSNPEAPEHVHQYGSPTILVNGKDVAGGPGDCCAPNSCRIYDGGAPSVALIQSKLDKRCCP